MLRNPGWYVGGYTFTAWYTQHVYAVLPLPNCPGTKISIKYLEESQINKRKRIVETPISSLLLEDALHKRWKDFMLVVGFFQQTNVLLYPQVRPGFTWALSQRVCSTFLVLEWWHTWTIPCLLSVSVLPSAPGGCMSAGFRCRTLLMWAAYRSQGIKLFLSSSPEWKLVSFVNETEWAKCNLWRGRAQILHSPHLQNKHHVSYDLALLHCLLLV